MAWAVVSYLAYTVFSGPSFGDMQWQSTFHCYNPDHRDCTVGNMHRQMLIRILILIVIAISLLLLKRLYPR